MFFYDFVVLLKWYSLLETFINLNSNRLGMSTLGGIIVFLQDLGIYDVVLPFFLVFVIVFGILEKTKVLGHDEVGGAKYSKRSLNSLLAFTISFLVIASTQLVSIISKFAANIVLLLMLIVFYLLLLGSFHKQDKEGFSMSDGTYKSILIFVTTVGVAVIFLYAMNWIDPIFDFLAHNWNKTYVSSLIFIIFIIAFIYIITKEPSAGSTGDKK